MKKLISILFVITILITACAPSPEAIAKQTADVATSTAMAWTQTPVPSPTPAYPTYSEIVNAYPAGVELSCTDAEVSDVTPDGKFVFTDNTKLLCAGNSQLTVAAGGTFTFSGDNYKTYGAKITIINTVTIDGKVFQAGSMLTVDKDLNWIQVSSWK